MCIREKVNDKNQVVTRIPLVNSAMSTSGDYERFFDEGGVRYHHIIDPRTGHSASKVRSATILAPTATQTDGMSKTAFVLGPEKALEIINRMPEYDAIDKSKGSRGKIACMREFRARVKKVLWDTFTWEELDIENVGEEAKVKEDVNNVID